MSGPLNVFFSGMACSCFLVASLFFFRFYRGTRDLLFLAFGVAFTVFGVERAALVFGRQWIEHEEQLYLLRLVGFAAIIIAMIYKNRRDHEP